MNASVVGVFLIPTIGALWAFVTTGRTRVCGALLTALAVVATVALTVWQVLKEGVLVYPVGGWSAPLGIELRCDGFSVLMLGLTAVVGLATTVYSTVYFGSAREGAEGSGLFWSLWLFLWAGLNCIFVSGDTFNLYLLLEFTLLASVALASLGGSQAALVSALRYLLVATVAALFYLLGVTLLYAEYSTLDLGGLRAANPSGFVSMGALVLIVGALCLKSALFPLHFWLPAAHSTAPAPVSAVLSALVVKAGFYVLVRFWFEVFEGAVAAWAGQLLAALGAVAILWGSWTAIRQTRLKMLIAYSTVAQVGYLFLVFPLVAQSSHIALTASTYHVLSHGLAKTAMFLAAGALLKSAHSDELERTRGTFRKAPGAVIALMIGGACLVGALPGGGAKGKLLSAVLDAGQWSWAAAILAGMALAAAYTFVAVRYCFRSGGDETPDPSSRWLGGTALAVALAAVALSFLSGPILEVLKIQLQK